MKAMYQQIYDELGFVQDLLKQNDIQSSYIKIDAIRTYIQDTHHRMFCEVCQQPGVKRYGLTGWEQTLCNKHRTD